MCLCGRCQEGRAHGIRKSMRCECLCLNTHICLKHIFTRIEFKYFFIKKKKKTWNEKRECSQGWGFDLINVKTWVMFHHISSPYTYSSASLRKAVQDRIDNRPCASKGGNWVHHQKTQTKKQCGPATFFSLSAVLSCLTQTLFIEPQVPKRLRCLSAVQTWPPRSGSPLKNDICLISVTLISPSPTSCPPDSL